jgi:trehalose 6-phosphate phosphatase
MSQDSNSDSKPIHLSSKEYDAVVFDLDGVITKTAKVHAAAWKVMFDEFLKDRSSDGKKFVPFDIQKDYREYVDGKLRYEGVKSFLDSRDIHLPHGSSKDPPDKETVCGLGNRKNLLFLKRLGTHGVETYDDAVDLIRRLKEEKVGIAIVSSSKNCTSVLEAAGLKNVFDAQVDGIVSEKLKLKSKPHPDIFLEAARRLKVKKERAVVIEDAEAGVEAGSRGGFGFVVGVDRIGRGYDLEKKGADRVVSDLSRILFFKEGTTTGKVDVKYLPSALDRLENIRTHLEGKQAAFFLDYDGTLTPIVRRPEDAVLSEDMRSLVSELSRHCPVAIVSGRDLFDVKNLVRVDGIFYAGSHGFDIAGPDDVHSEHQHGREFLPVLDEAEREIEERLKEIPGARVERKKFSIASHYREVKPEKARLVEKAVDWVLAKHPELRKGTGKKVFEMLPDIDWDKGKALLWLMKKLDLNHPDVLPFYLGDDVTDEDAFGVLLKRGVGIVVSEKVRPSKALYRLRDPDEVFLFLEKMLAILKGGG